MSNLTDIATVPVVDVWGEAARARRIEGERITLALLELAPDSVVPGHHHENEQLGMVITGSVTFTVGDETRELGPGGTWRIPSGTHHQLAVIVEQRRRIGHERRPGTRPDARRWPARPGPDGPP